MFASHVVIVVYVIFFVMIRRPPRSTRTDTLFPCTTLCRSQGFVDPGLRPGLGCQLAHGGAGVAVSVYAVVPFRVLPYCCQLLRWRRGPARSEEHTSELQSLMRISYAVFCLQKKTNKLMCSRHRLLYGIHFISI